MRTFVALSLLLCSFSAYAQQKNSTVSSSKPPLVVGIVVDQMRYDFLHRYYNKYQEGGFKRLMNQGFVCHNHHYDYAQTVTAAGHASVYTGSVPSMHGIVGNEWFDRSNKREMYCVSDSSVRTVGSTNVSAGKMSPKNLLTSTITDQLHLATNFKSKVIGISLKDRGAILPAGHSANGAFWFDAKSGNWITSTFYSEELPSWVKSYNDKKRPNQLLQEGWKTLLPIEQYTESEADDQPYESKITADKKSFFPYTFTASFGESFAALSTSPHGLTLTKELALEAIKNENLGRNGTTDFLAVSFSSTDYVGHAFGPYSVETEDMYLRLDRDIAELLSFLDKWVGKDNFTVFLTADHGVMDVTDMWKKYKLPAGRLAYSDMVKAVKRTLTEKYGDASFYESSANYQLYFDRRQMAAKGVAMKEIHTLIRPVLMEFDGISDVILSDEVGLSNLNNHLQELFKNGYHSVRSGDIQLVTMPGWIASSITATHGSTYNYDTHIPLIFYGAGVAQGKTYERTGVSDTAPTLAALLKILAPSGTMGEVIPAVIR
jgi:predicted AlkP superfamily pyrophosphatase or phosphodiesterase